MYRFAVIALLCAAPLFAEQKARQFPYPERLSYRVEWHMITAGTATVDLSRGTPDDWEINLDLESTGTVSKLYRVLDKYRAVTDDGFCTASADLDAQQGKRHRLTHLAFDNSAHRVTLTDRDLIKHSAGSKEIAIAPCTHDIVAALALMRTLKIEPGQWASVPVTNGNKMVFAKIHALGREPIEIAGKTYQTVRYEAFLFNGVLYKRKGRLLIWLTDDTAHVPVEFRFQLGFPVGTISLELQNQQTR